MSLADTDKGAGRISGGRGLFLRDRRFRTPLARLRRPLEALEVDERLRPAHDLGRAEADQELLGSLEGAQADEARAHALEDMCVGSRSHQEVVLAREAKGLVVRGLEQQTGVVYLEDVDLAEMPVEHARVGDAVQPVERMRKVDDSALFANGYEGFGH